MNKKKKKKNNDDNNNNKEMLLESKWVVRDANELIKDMSQTDLVVSILALLRGIGLTMDQAGYNNLTAEAKALLEPIILPKR